MLAIRATHAGGPEVLEAADLPDPAPGPGQVVVRNAAVGLNFIDTYQRSGLYPVRYPAVLGAEAAGVVEALGEGVAGVKVGDRVAYLGQGCYAQKALVAADRVIPLPAGVSVETAAASLLKGMTVEFLLRRCFPVQAGQTILVHAAAGGVGLIMTQWAKAIGARVIATVGSPEKGEIARAHGADEIVLYRSEDVAARVRDLTGGVGVPVAYDSVGKDTFEGTLASLARRGLFVSFGNASGPAPAFEPGRLARAGSVYFTRPTLFDYIVTPQELEGSAGALFGMIASGKVKIEIGQTYPLAETRRAHEELEGRQTTGASVLIP